MTTVSEIDAAIVASARQGGKTNLVRHAVNEHFASLPKPINYGANKLKRLNRSASVKARLLARKSRGK